MQGGSMTNQPCTDPAPGTTTLTVVQRIARPIAEVRAQFADVEHHARVPVHRGVTFEALDHLGPRCHRQTTTTGLMRIRQEIEIREQADGSLLNTVIRGRLRGSTLTYRFTPLAPDETEVTATVEARLPLVARPFARRLVQSLGRSLATALEEDRHDLESGRYAASLRAH